MAALFRSPRFVTSSCRYCYVARPKNRPSILTKRPLSMTPPRWQKELEEHDLDDLDDLDDLELNDGYEDLDLPVYETALHAVPFDRNATESSDDDLAARMDVDTNPFEEHRDIRSDFEMDQHKKALEDSAQRACDQGIRSRKRGKPKRNFWNMGESTMISNTNLNAPGPDDMTSIGLEELEHHKEMRHYARLTAWEMPLLSKMAKPFEPPEANMPLRFRYTTYMGESHPAENKVIVEFCPEDMPDLTAPQRTKLKKLVGTRYNPETDIVKMSAENFETQAKNKRYLGDLVDKLIVEAKDTQDTFEDVPLYLKYHTFKRKPRFPKEWRMNQERIAMLDAQRLSAQQKEQQLLEQGQVVDGVRQIGEALAKIRVAPPPEPAMALPGKTARGKKVGIRR